MDGHPIVNNDFTHFVTESLRKIYAQQENQYNDVIKRLDKLQKVVEQQTQRQNELEKKLDAVTKTTEDTKRLVQDSPRNGKHQLLTRLTGLKKQNGAEGTLSLAQGENADSGGGKHPPVNTSTADVVSVGAGQKETTPASRRRAEDGDEIVTILNTEFARMTENLQKILEELTKSPLLTKLNEKIQEASDKIENTRAHFDTAMQKVTATLKQHLDNAESKITDAAMQEFGLVKTALGQLAVLTTTVKDEILAATDQRAQGTERLLSSGMQEESTILQRHLDKTEQNLAALLKQESGAARASIESAKEGILTACSEQTDNVERHVDTKMQEVSSILSRCIDDSRHSFETLFAKETALVKSTISSLHVAVLEANKESMKAQKENTEDIQQNLNTKLLEATTQLKDHSSKAKEEVATLIVDTYSEQTKDTQSYVDKAVQECTVKLKQHVDGAKDYIVVATKTECRQVTSAFSDLATETANAKADILEACSKNTQDIKNVLKLTAQSSAAAMVPYLDRLEGKISAKNENQFRVVGSKFSEIIQGMKTLQELLNDMYTTRRESDAANATIFYSILQQINVLNMTTCSTKEEVLKSLSDHTETTQTLLETTLTDSVDQLKTDLYKTKREIFIVTEIESQQTRDRITGAPPSNRTYICDFYVENFQSLIRSGKTRHSLPWYIHQFQSTVAGFVHFLPNGEMEIWLVYGRRPREVGLQPKSKVTLTVKATIMDTSGKLPKWDVGAKVGALNEDLIERNEDCGYVVGTVLCNEVIQHGYAGDCSYGAVLVRYKIDVL